MMYRPVLLGYFDMNIFQRLFYFYSKHFQMNRFLQFVGFVTLISAPIYFSAWLYEHFTELIKNILQILGSVTIFLALGYLVARAIFGKNWLFKGGARLVLGGDLIVAIRNFQEELPRPTKETIAELGGHLIYRLTRVGLIGLFLTMIPIWLLWQQNLKIERQNILINTQNTRIDQQTNLIEADRRSSLIFLMSNIMDKVDEEIREQKMYLREKGVAEDQIDMMQFRLSQSLIGRIAALSQAFKPYLYLQNDTLTSKPLSPERGQLLMAITKSNLDTSTLRSVYSNTTFEKADMSRANLTGANLRGANLGEASLAGADLNNADMSGANLIEADLRRTNLERANLSNAKLTEANLGNTKMAKANLSGANLFGAKLFDSDLSEADLSGSILNFANLVLANLSNSKLIKADLSFANLGDAGLPGANLTEADLSGADLSNAYLFEADLAGANLIGVNLRGADFSGANLKRVSFVPTKRHSLSESEQIRSEWLSLIAREETITALQLLKAKSLEGSIEGLPQRIVDSILLIKPELFGNIKKMKQE